MNVHTRETGGSGSRQGWVSPLLATRFADVCDTVLVTVTEYLVSKSRKDVWLLTV